MKKLYSLPYGKKDIQFQIDDSWNQTLIEPKHLSPHSDPKRLIYASINNPINCCGLPEKIDGSFKIVITLNDKTRPVPNSLLLPPLLDELCKRGAVLQNITLLIAVGTHVPMSEDEYIKICDKLIYKQCHIISHNCDDTDNLVYKGETSRGTPVFVNRLFDQADLRIVVGDIEPHHFAGYSGGVKSASIGVCGRKTINKNHSLLIDERSCVGNYTNNPLRQDIEEIGKIIRVDFALNAILNEEKEIVNVFFGTPQDVINEGIRIIKNNSMVKLDQKFDLVIASAGGYPKDINLYQSQKGLTHASLFCKPGGIVLLAAECCEGIGSETYFNFMKNVKSHEEGIEKFKSMEFMVGPHKAFQFATIAKKIRFKLFSLIEPSLLNQLLISPIIDFQEDVVYQLSNISSSCSIAILPHAIATIPYTDGD